MKWFQKWKERKRLKQRQSTRQLMGIRKLLPHGVAIHKRQTPLRIVGAAVINQFVISLFVTTLWISILYGSPYLPLLATRLFQALILAAVETVVIFSLSKTFSLRAKAVGMGA